jgi:ATP-dependent DNA ligase
MGYNNREQCLQFIRAQNANWSNVKIMVFDTPQVADKPYSERLEILQQSKILILIITLISIDILEHPILSVVKPIVCSNRDHMEAFFKQICKNQYAEGIILRDPTAWYYKRNFFLKKELLDEAIVMKVSSGQYKW